MGDRLLRVNVVARRLDKTPRWIRQLIRTGRLQGQRLSARDTRVRESDLEAFLREINRPEQL